MNRLRQQIVDGSKHLLNEGEIVAHVVRTLEGPSRIVAMGIAMFFGVMLSTLAQVSILALPIMLLVFYGLYRKRAILATDENLVLVDCGRWFWKPAKIMERMPIETPIGKPSGLWMQVKVADHRLYVVQRRPNMEEIKAADADLED
ncbi:MAG: hypothetical protein AB7L13_10410 [Acidimicrobiia bacterium]